MFTLMYHATLGDDSSEEEFAGHFSDQQIAIDAAKRFLQHQIDTGEASGTIEHISYGEGKRFHSVMLIDRDEGDVDQQFTIFPTVLDEPVGPFTRVDLTTKKV